MLRFPTHAFLRMQRALVWGCLLTIFAGSAIAEGSNAVVVLDLPACLARAATNALVRAALHDEAAAEEGVLAIQSRGRLQIVSTLLGTVVPEARGDAVDSEDSTGMLEFDSLGPLFRAETTAIKPLATFGKLAAAERAAAGLRRQRSAETELAGRRIAVATRKLYYACVLVEDELALSDDVSGWLTAAGEHLDRHLKDSESNASPVDRMKLKSYQSEVEMAQAGAMSRRSIGRDALSRLVELPAGGIISPADDKLRAVPAELLSSEDAEASIQTRNPALAALDSAIEALEGMITFESVRDRPDLFLAGRISYSAAPHCDDQTNPFVRDDYNYFSGGIGIGLRHDWTRGLSSSRSGRSRAQLAALRERRDALLALLKHELHSAAAGVNCARDKLAAARNGFKAARIWSTAAMDGFRLGTLPAKDLIDGLSAFVRARLALLAATHEYNCAVAEYVGVVGEEIQGDLKTSRRSGRD